jgi:hypothetical protein
MVTGIRNPFNASFTADKYAAFLDDLNHRFPGAIDFRVAETPVFIEKELGRQMIDTCEYIILTSSLLILGSAKMKMADTTLP